MRRVLAFGLVAGVVAGLAGGCEMPGKKAATRPVEPEVKLSDPPGADPFSSSSANSAKPPRETLDPKLLEAIVKQARAEWDEEQKTRAKAAPTPMTPVPEAASTPQPVTPQPAPVAESAKVEIAPARMVDELAAKVSKRAESDPRDVSAQLDLALLSHLKEESSPDPKKMAALPAEDREIVSAVIDALTNLRAGVRTDPNATYQSRVRPLVGIADRLRARGDLTITTLTMTSGVVGYGQYEPMPAMLNPRGETPTVLYAEVANFSSRQNDRSMWETQLTSTVTLFNAAGVSVWSGKAATTSDSSRNRRTDFFIATPLRLPPMKAGKYTLKQTITDHHAGRVAEAVVNLESK